MSEEKKVTAEELDAVVGGTGSSLNYAGVDDRIIEKERVYIMATPAVPSGEEDPSPGSAGSSEQIKYTKKGGRLF